MTSPLNKRSFIRTRFKSILKREECSAFISGFMIAFVAIFIIATVPFIYSQNDQGQNNSHNHAAHTQPDSQHHHDTNAQTDEQQTVTADEVGVNEKLGEKIPMTAKFRDEEGKEMSLSDFIDKPTLILPIFYYCPQTCRIMLSNLAQSLNRIPLKPGIDFRVIALSFNYEETPEDALQAKGNYTQILSEDFPTEDWKFLTGDLSNIHAFTEAIGFRFKSLGQHNFIHPNVLVAVSGDGTIIRYLYGPDFLPFDMGMALTEAARGTPALSIRRLLTYCFNYEPEKKTYTFRAVRFIVIGVVFVMGISLFFLLRRREPKEAQRKE